ncbi:MAG: UbiA family prenyltransferase [Chloroflexota bacterium]
MNELSWPTFGRPTEPTGKVAAYLRLFDPAPVSLVLLATAGFSALAAKGWPAPDRLVPLLLAVLLTQFAIAWHNHYCDRDLDAATRPWRAIPRGLVPARLAVGVAWALFVAGIVAALRLGGDVAGLVALGTGAGFVYNARLKRTIWSWLPFWVAVPALPVCAFVAMGRYEPGLWVVYLVGGPLVLAIHLADALADAELDAVHGVRGLAQRLGPRRSLFVCWGAFGAAFALALLFRRSAAPLDALFAVAAVLLVAAVPLGLSGRRGQHWLAIMSASLALALAWIAGLAG